MLRNFEKQNPNSALDDTKSTYKIYSRIACNFVFPNTYKRPKPIDGKEAQKLLEISLEGSVG